MFSCEFCETPKDTFSYRTPPVAASVKNVAALKWQYYEVKSSHLEVFLIEGVLRICSKLTGEHSCQSVTSINLLCNFINITFGHGCSPVNLLHVFRTSFFKNISGWLLLMKSCILLCGNSFFQSLAVLRKSLVMWERELSFKTELGHVYAWNPWVILSLLHWFILMHTAGLSPYILASAERLGNESCIK